MNGLEYIIAELKRGINATDFAAVCEAAVAKIKELPAPQGTITPLLNFMAEHPNLRYGMPGAFVQFIESFAEAEYAAPLIKSIERQPTEHNTWMLLRVMNTWRSPRQDEYIAVMKAAAVNPKTPANLKQTITEDLADFE